VFSYERGTPVGHNALRCRPQAPHQVYSQPPICDICTRSRRRPHPPWYKSANRKFPYRGFASSLFPAAEFRNLYQGSPETGGVYRSTCGPISPYSGRDCVKSLRSSYTGLYPQRGGRSKHYHILARISGQGRDRLVLYCRTTSASTAPCTSRRMCLRLVLVTVPRVSRSGQGRDIFTTN